ncbi:MAG: hypothetical protein BWX99_02673 [Deltaproteobacteria bacterium ADurb.Bin151]|nr:MAG: hypothetical protein BWX99_02673 [Deltaproteobacteria bacterium ADurb.Bin151]
MTWNPSRLSRSEPRARPSDTRATDVMNRISRAGGIPQGFTEGKRKENANRMATWSRTSVHPPSTFPRNMLMRVTGATSTALSTSSFRSQMMYSPKKTEPKITDMVSTPG